MNPYRITGPAIVSFSGGRTSGKMLHEILGAYNGLLPPDIQVCFCNTGKERVETLDYVAAVSRNWNVQIRWLERVPGEHGQRFIEVSHNSAARSGEPFDALIAEKQYLPNPVTRFCTTELKIRVMRDFARSLGWEHWTNIIGLRADEPGRVGKALAKNDDGKERWLNACPLSDDGITERDVLDFWWGKDRDFDTREMPQGFDLNLRSYEGNCDLCFLKGRGKITRIMRERPDLAQWWIQNEALALASKPSGARFRDDRPSYAHLRDFALNQGVLPFDIFDDSQSCVITCTD